MSAVIFAHGSCGLTKPLQFKFRSGAYEKVATLYINNSANDPTTNRVNLKFHQFNKINEDVRRSICACATYILVVKKKMLPACYCGIQSGP